MTATACASCGTGVDAGVAFCGSCGASVTPAAPVDTSLRTLVLGADASMPAVVRDRAKHLLTIAGGSLVVTTLILWIGFGMGGIVVATGTSIAGFVYLLAGWGVRHGAVWAIRWMPAEARALPDVHHYFWSDEECPGCGSAESMGAAYCQSCGHGLNPPPTPFLEGARFAFERAFRPQPPEPSRTLSFRKRAPHETTDKLFLFAIAAIAVGWFASNSLASLSRIGITVGVIVPTVLMLFWLRKQDRYEPEPMNLLLIAFAWGMFCGVLVMPLNTLFISFTGLYQIAGFTEEVTKGAIVLLFAWHRIVRKEINGPTDGLIYAGAAGLGFAAMENFSYVIQIWMGSGDLLGGFVLRAGGIINHMMYAGLTGSFLGLMLLRNGRVTPRDLLIGMAPGAVIHALHNSMSLFGPLSLILIFVPTALMSWAFFKLLAESLRDEGLWGYTAGEAPVEPHA